MNAIQEMKSLADALSLDGSKVVEFAPLPSGMAYLHVRLLGRCFVMAYYPSDKGYGVDEVLDGEGFETGYKQWFAEFGDACKAFTKLLHDANS